MFKNDQGQKIPRKWRCSYTCYSVSALSDWLRSDVSASDVLQIHSNWPNGSCGLQSYEMKWHNCMCSVCTFMQLSKTFLPSARGEQLDLSESVVVLDAMLTATHHVILNFLFNERITNQKNVLQYLFCNRPQIYWISYGIWKIHSPHPSLCSISCRLDLFGHPWLSSDFKTNKTYV